MEEVAGFEQRKVFDKVEVTEEQEVEVTDKHVEVTDKQVEVTDKQEKIVVKVDAGVQHNGFFETSFEVSPASEDPEPEREVSQVVRKDWGSQTPVLQTRDWSGQVEAAGRVDFGVQVELSGASELGEVQWQRSLSSEEVDVDAFLEAEEKEKQEESMVSLVILLEERVKELEGLLDKERRTKVTGRKRRVEDWDKELRAVRLALQVALEESNLVRLELEATKESKSSMEAGFSEERRRGEEEVREKVKEAERRRRDLEVALEVAVRESAGLREQVSRMEARIEELEGEVRKRGWGEEGLQVRLNMGGGRRGLFTLGLANNRTASSTLSSGIGSRCDTPELDWSGGEDEEGGLRSTSR